MRIEGFDVDDASSMHLTLLCSNSDRQGPIFDKVEISTPRWFDNLRQAYCRYPELRQFASELLSLFWGVEHVDAAL